MKFKALTEQFDSELNTLFQERAGRAVSLTDLHERMRKFKAEQLPQGQEAIAMAKQSKMLRPRDGDLRKKIFPLTDELRQALLQAEVAKYSGDYRDYFTIRFFTRKSWADVLAQNPAVVKEAFGIPQSADPAQTVAALCETLIARAFDWEFRDAQLQERVDDHLAQIRKRGYHAVIEAADKPGVSMTELKAHADKALKVKPTLGEIEDWQETHFDKVMAGAELREAVDIADETLAERQRDGLDL